MERGARHGREARGSARPKDRPNSQRRPRAQHPPRPRAPPPAAASITPTRAMRPLCSLSAPLAASHSQTVRGRSRQCRLARRRGGEVARQQQARPIRRGEPGAAHRILHAHAPLAAAARRSAATRDVGCARRAVQSRRAKPPRYRARSPPPRELPPRLAQPAAREEATSIDSTSDTTCKSPSLVCLISHHHCLTVKTTCRLCER